MIGSLLRLPVVALFGIISAWIAILAFGVHDRDGNWALTDFLRAFPSIGTRSDLEQSAALSTAAACRKLEDQFGGLGAKACPSLAVVWIHSRIVASILPYLITLSLAGIAAGLAFRERIRCSKGYASPTGAYLARMLFLAGVLWLILFATSPLPSPAWSLYLSGCACFLGGLWYFGNLPIAL